MCKGCRAKLRQPPPCAQAKPTADEGAAALKSGLDNQQGQNKKAQEALTFAEAVVASNKKKTKEEDEDSDGLPELEDDEEVVAEETEELQGAR